jgi:hypothetical protein
LLLLALVETNRELAVEMAGSALSDLLGWAATVIEDARLRDLDSYRGVVGPVAVLRPGIGAVGLAVGRCAERGRSEAMASASTLLDRRVDQASFDLAGGAVRESGSQAPSQVGPSAPDC